jgi:hypothetical protein
MNTEKLEKLKKSLDNKFIPDNMKDKIRAEIKKLEADIKTDETITATEVKEEVKEIEKKVEKALEVAEEKEEQAEAKAEEKKEKAPRKAREKKATQSETKTPKVEPKSTAKKKSVFSIAKEIRKDNESWEDAKERARKMMKSETTETKKKTRTETDKLLAMVRRNKEYKKLAGTSNLPKDASRRALPRGKRVSADGNVYYENRANRVDVGGFKNAYLENGGEIEMENSNLYFVGRGRDINGNKVIKISFPNQKPFSIQTLGNLPKTHRILREYDNDKDITPEEIATIEREIISYVEEFGSKKQKESLRKYEGGGYADKGVYVETLDEEIDLTDDGIVKATKTQQGGNKSFGERREMHGASPEALAFDNGGKVGRYSILGEVDGEQPVLYATTDDKERIKPLVNMAEIDLYELTGKNHRIFVTDEVTDDEVYHYGNGGRTRERRYVNHSQDYEVRYSKDKPHRRGYGYENGGSIEDERFKKFINSQVSYIISLKTISQKREPIQNLLDNMEDYRSGSEIVKRITTDNLKYALQQKTVSKMNEVLRISLNALQYAEGGTIIGTPETPLARGLDIDYTGLVGETGGMSAGEMFAEGGSIENQYEGKTPSQIWSMLSISQKYHFLEDHSKEIESTPMSIEKATKTAYKFLPTKIKKSFENHVEMGQYAMGGSLGNHGLKQGDEIIKTMSGGVQKVKTKSGDIVYVNLANGYRGVTPPLPFAKGGYTNERRHVNKAQDYEVRYAKNKPNRTGYFGKRSFDDGGFMTDPNFGDFQNGVYATGGVTKNYINRNQLNTITIKKGDKKLTYKVSDVYNGAYKLEDGGNLERTAFYVSKRNVVKVQLKDGKDVKVANGYWIKKGAKPIHTSKYDDGGEVEYKGGGKTTFKEKATAIAKNFEGKKVEPKYQKEYGKTYDKAEAKEVGNKIAGSQKAKYDSKMSVGGSTKRGGAMQLAKQIRKDGESWQSALKRANEQMRKK